MSQLTKQVEKTNLTPIQTSFVSLRVGHKPVSEMSPNPLKRALIDILSKSSFDAGSPMANDPQILQAQTEALFLELKGKFGALTLPEITEAFNRGVRGESGPYFGFCAKTYHQFLKWFFELPERGKAWLAFLDEQSNELPKSSKPLVLTKEYLANSAKNAFRNYKDSGVMPMVPFAVYDALKELLGVKTLIQKEDWESVKQEAKKAYEKQMSRGKKKPVQLDFTLGNVSFESHVKAIGLRRFFDRMKEEGKELDL